MCGEMKEGRSLSGNKSVIQVTLGGEVEILPSKSGIKAKQPYYPPTSARLLKLKSRRDAILSRSEAQHVYPEFFTKFLPSYECYYDAHVLDCI
jgi:hypothetical protein